MSRFREKSSYEHSQLARKLDVADLMTRPTVIPARRSNISPEPDVRELVFGYRASGHRKLPPAESLGDAAALERSSRREQLAPDQLQVPGPMPGVHASEPAVHEKAGLGRAEALIQFSLEWPRSADLQAVTLRGKLVTPKVKGIEPMLILTEMISEAGIALPRKIIVAKGRTRLATYVMEPER